MPVGSGPMHCSGDRASGACVRTHLAAHPARFAGEEAREAQLRPDLHLSVVLEASVASRIESVDREPVSGAVRLQYYLLYRRLRIKRVSLMFHIHGGAQCPTSHCCPAQHTDTPLSTRSPGARHPTRAATSSGPAFRASAALRRTTRGTGTGGRAASRTMCCMHAWGRYPCRARSASGPLWPQLLAPPLAPPALGSCRSHLTRRGPAAAGCPPRGRPPSC